ncbi:MAG: ABC transporter permease, partial [Vicinamibacterales bacterium]
DAAVFAFGLAVTTLVGLVFGLVPALQAARNDPHRGLQRGASSTGRTTGGHRRTRNILVVAEVAIALVLLVGSGLLLRSMERLFAVPVGFDSSRVLTLQVQETGHRYREDSARYHFFAQALEAVGRVPGVASAALTTQIPLSGDRDEYGVAFEATPTRAAGTYGAFRYAVSPEYVETLRIPLRRGRLLTEHDDAGAPRVALISESLAKARFHEDDPIGQRLRVGGAARAPPYNGVGVVGDVKPMWLALTDSDAVYIPTNQWHWVDQVQSLVVRTRGDAAALAPAMRQAIWSVDKDQPIVRVATMDDLVTASEAERRFALILFEAFALAALVLAAAGLYGVLSGSVAERTREIGVRSALGASRASILALVVRQGLTLTAVGAVIGLVGAIAASRAIVTLLFGVSQLDPVTYLGVVALLSGVSCAACSVPAWRAARVDPAVTLRAE